MFTLLKLSGQGQGQGQGHSRSKNCFSWITSELFTNYNNSKNKKNSIKLFSIHIPHFITIKIFVGVMSLKKLDVPYQKSVFSK